MEPLRDIIRFSVTKALEIWSNPKLIRDTVEITVVMLFLFGFELFARRNWRRYLSKNVRIDILYFIFYYAGFFHFLVWNPIYRWAQATLTPLLSPIQLNLIPRIPGATQIIVFILFTDLLEYWIHRLKHSSRILWPFHSIHHSQGMLTAVANYRIHFVDEVFRRTVFFFAFLVVGVSAPMWIVADLLLNLILALQHSGLKWTLGPLGMIFASPRFHGLHHSIEDRHQHHNYGILFCFWDRLFGTAAGPGEEVTTYGLSTPIPESFVRQQLSVPFVELARSLFPRWADRFQQRGLA